MNAEQKLIFDWIGSLPVRIPNWDIRLPQMYEELNTKYFNGSVPTLSEDFVCEFCDMPRDTAGIFIDAADAVKQSTTEVIMRPGIRINSALKVLRDHVKIALLHEMIHANGIKGHNEPFNMELSRLILAGAYNTLL